MKKLLVLFSVVFLISCSVQKDCGKYSWNPQKFEVTPKDSVYIEVDRILYLFCGTFVKSREGVWYRYCWGDNLYVWEKALVYNEWKSLPPCR
jgi:hypothetical protein